MYVFTPTSRSAIYSHKVMPFLIQLSRKESENPLASFPGFPLSPTEIKINNLKRHSCEDDEVLRTVMAALNLLCVIWKYARILQ